MKFTLSLLSITIIFSIYLLPLQAGPHARYGKYVNPFIGTDAHGHTFPGACLPFGMVQLSPDTRVTGWDACGGYHYSDTTLMGFSHTHLSGTGVADYGDILVTPSAGPRQNPHLRFSHTTEHAEPGYYQVYLPGERINAELTATLRVGVHRYTFDPADTSTITFDLHHGLGADSVLNSEIQIVNDHELQGFRRSRGWANDRIIYFNAQFSRSFSECITITNDTLPGHDRIITGNNLRASFRFPRQKNSSIVLKVGLSSVGYDGARNNIAHEVPGWNFDLVRKKARQAWEKELGTIEVFGGQKGRLVTFYTALYHALLTPNIQSDDDGRYRGMDNQIHRAHAFTMYTVFSLWDTFRAEHPLCTIIDPHRDADFVNSLLAKYDESGHLPVWELASNETWTMIGYHSVPVIVDAFVKGIHGFDPEKALDAMKHSAMMDRSGLTPYRKFGYIPGDLESESVSKTLEYAYDDWCIAQMALALGHTSDYEEYLQRAQSYQNVFDPSTSFMRGKENGCWVTPFDPRSVTVHYTEANAWQYSFFVPHDITGLVRDMGGDKGFSAKLDSLFYSSSALAGRQQADISGLIGQYAQGNEPSHHVAYLYDYVGEPWKTEEILRVIMDSLYTPSPGGLCGNDDCGQMSAWYVLSALGFYQVCPGKPEYSIGLPLFPKIIVHTGNGKPFIIESTSQGNRARYIQSAILNGHPFTKSYLTHTQITAGGRLRFFLGDSPSESWGKKPGDYPVTSVPETIVPVPFFSSETRSFTDSLEVSLSSPMPGTKIYYTNDSSEPSQRSLLYDHPVMIHESKAFRAVAIRENGKTSDIAEAAFLRNLTRIKIKLLTPYSDQYTGGGTNALVDGLKGGPDFRLGAWQGYEQVDLDALIDLEKTDTLLSVSLGCLQDVNAWIFFPQYVEYSFSTDGIHFMDTIRTVNGVSQHDENPQVQRFSKVLTRLPARYIHIRATNIGTCPPWHRGAGGKAWLFADECEVTTK